MIKQILKSIKKFPLLRHLVNLIRPLFFPGSKKYWDNRYKNGGNSGAGSYGKFAEFKADILNEFIVTNKIQTVIEFGCGDGNQLKLAKYPHYIGVDVSSTAIALCRELFDVKIGGGQDKEFICLSDYFGQTAELSLSLDVIYHLVEDDVFDEYMKTLFNASTKYLIVYASNKEEPYIRGTHVRHRKFTDWIETHKPNWKLIQHIPNKYPYNGDHTTGSFADFYIFQKID
jgi:hypothetical protein